MRIDVYTDGSSVSIGNNEFEASSGFIIYIDDEICYASGKYFPTGTISIGEVTAMHDALYVVKNLIDNADEDVEVNIYSDSIYAINSITKWISKWSKTPIDQEWIGSSGKAVAHQELFKDIWKDFLCKESPYRKRIHYYHIHSHIAKSGYERARYTFMKENQHDITIEDFKKHSARNDKVDAYANEIRTNQKDGEIIYPWESTRNTSIRNGLIKVSLKHEQTTS